MVGLEIDHSYQNLWNMLTVINLETNHRQGEDERLLKERVRPKGHPDLKDSAFNIICTRKVAGEMNAKYVRELPGEMIEIDAVNFKANHKTFKPTLHKSGDGLKVLWLALKLTASISIMSPGSSH